MLEDINESEKTYYNILNTITVSTGVHWLVGIFIIRGEEYTTHTHEINGKQYGTLC